MKLTHFTSVEQLHPTAVMALIERALVYKSGDYKPIEVPFYIANLFFEASTRTHTSFEMAQVKLGLKVIQFNPSLSSVNKGETLYDTLLTLKAIGMDAVVIRSAENEYYKPLIDQKNLPMIINGGDGSGQHPSQSMLDLMTIYAEYKTLTGLKIAIVGDICHSRVARSDSMLLTQLGNEVYFCGPYEWYDDSFDAYGRYVDLDEVISTVDVCMLLRVQHERHGDAGGFQKQNYHERYGLTLARHRAMKAGAIIMHPAPINRGVELADELVEAENSRIVEQMRNGVYIRMAILEAIVRGKYEDLD